MLLVQVALSQKLENSLLWSISGNGIKQPSYLYGTMHITCDTLFKEHTHRALKASKVLYLEIPDQDESEMQDMMKILDMSMMKGGEKISALLPKADYQKLDSIARSIMGVPAAMLDRIYPSVVLLILSGMEDYQKCPYSIESALTHIVRQQDKEIKGLETTAEQMKMFTSVPLEEQVEGLTKFVNGNSSDEINLDALYASGDIDEMARLIYEAMDKKNADVLLIRRNKNWVNQIKVLTAENPIFFAVGAGHLGGEEGVIRLLRKEGFTVEPVLQ